MSISKKICSICKVCSVSLLLCSLGALSVPQAANGQALELNGGWSYTNGNNGVNGYEAGGAWWFTKRVTLAANYDSAWDNSTLTAFQFSQIGAFAVHSYMHSFLVGPRIFFSTDWTTKHKLNPFGEAQFGVTALSQRITAGTSSVHSSDSGFSWMLGGGAEYLFNPHFSARGNLDLLRTHLASSGQSHFRFVLGLTYTFGARE